MISHVLFDYLTGNLESSRVMSQNVLVHRVRIGQITLEARQSRNTKLLVFRNDRADLPHLLISFGNVSKEIDIHLKTRSTGGQESLLCIAKIPEATITTVFQDLEPRFQEMALRHITNVRPVRPGWLARKGYLVSYLGDEAERNMVEIFAPKRKYHSKWERVLRAAGLDDFVQSELPGEMVFLPSVLHELKRLHYSRPVMAYRVRGKHKHATTALRLGLTPKGRLRWFPMHELVNDLRYIGESAIEELKHLVPPDKWRLIWEELRLGEVDWMASRVEGPTNSFL